jgi:Uma2 family endonuclease
MPAEPKHHRFSVRDYHQMGQTGIIAEDARVELIEGEIIEMSPIGSRHFSHVAHLTELFYAQLISQVTIFGQNPLRLGDLSEPIPDLMILRRRDDSYLARTPTPTDVLLLVEVADTSLRFDRDVKIPLYARYGVETVWLLDVNNNVLEIYEEPVDGIYTIKRTPPHATRISLESLPDFEIQVADLFV